MAAALKAECPGCFEAPPKDSEACGCGYGAEVESSASMLPPGTLLSSPDGKLSYILGRVLGTGAFAFTYLARTVDGNERVAIKEYMPRQLAGRIANSTLVRPDSKESRPYFDHGLKRFLQESEALKQFKHPNIVEVLAFFEANDTAYLVMPYYEAMTLADYVDTHGALQPDAATRVIISILDGLRHVHSTKVDGRRWTHRDVKPENVLLRADATPLLIDFGAARTEAINEKRKLSVVLTPGYAPPEQHVPVERSDGPWVDVYGCAATLYFTLTGENPVDALVRKDAVDRRQADPLRPPHQVKSTISRRLSHNVVRGLALDFRERPQDADKFTNLLHLRRRSLGEIIGETLILLKGRWTWRIVTAAAALTIIYLFARVADLQQQLTSQNVRDEVQRIQLTAERDALRAQVAGVRETAEKAASAKAELETQVAAERAETAARLADAEAQAQAAAERAAQLSTASTTPPPADTGLQRAAEIITGTRSVQVRGESDALVRTFSATMTVRGNEIQFSNLRLTINPSAETSDPGKAIIQAKRFRAFIVVNGRGTKVTSSWICCWDYKTSGAASFRDEDVEKITASFPCTPNDLASGACQVGLYVGGPESPSGRGTTAAIVP
jgi:serine/threonine protein kinase